STNVITVRIDQKLNENLDKVRRKLGISKADLIRNYLEISKCVVKQKGSILTVITFVDSLNLLLLSDKVFLVVTSV
ncbi:MAG: ribbon-helix-helix protein, CopG family, partial [Candidatus Thorarchaeota archaeon]